MHCAMAATISDGNRQCHLPSQARHTQAYPSDKETDCWQAKLQLWQDTHKIVTIVLSSQTATHQDLQENCYLW